MGGGGGGGVGVSFLCFSSSSSSCCCCCCRCVLSRSGLWSSSYNIRTGRKVRILFTTPHFCIHPKVGIGPDLKPPSVSWAQFIFIPLQSNRRCNDKNKIHTYMPHTQKLPPPSSGIRMPRPPELDETTATHKTQYLSREGNVSVCPFIHQTHEDTSAEVMVKSKRLPMYSDVPVTRIVEILGGGSHFTAVILYFLEVVEIYICLRTTLTEKSSKPDGTTNKTKTTQCRIIVVAFLSLANAP